MPSSESAAGTDRRHARAGEVLVAALDDCLRELARLDPLVRTADPDAVHDMRVAVTRIRTALTTFGTLLDSPLVRLLQPELRWLAQELGSARDLDVVRDRIRALRGEAAEGEHSPAIDAALDRLERDAAAAHEALTEAFDSERYARLIDDVLQLVRSPEVTDAAHSRAAKVLPRLVDRRIRRLRKAMAAAEGAAAAERDEALHAVRKAAKKVRYSADVMAPVKGRRAAKLSAAAKKVQTALGEQHDTVLVRHALGAAAVAGADTSDAEVVKRALELETARGDAAEADYERLRHSTRATFRRA